jgi:hypothetical protein
MRLAEHARPVRQFVVIGVRVVEETTFLDHEAPRVDTVYFGYGPPGFKGFEPTSHVPACQ